jgi:hypothetical protein
MRTICRSADGAERGSRRHPSEGHACAMLTTPDEVKTRMTVDEALMQWSFLDGSLRIVARDAKEDQAGPAR